MTAPLKVFVSYSHEDDRHRKVLLKHLSTLIRERVLEVWHDRQLTPGQRWAEVIDAELAQADIFLLLLTENFLASDYCNGVELKQALAMERSGAARVVPVILRSCDWEKSPVLGCFNAVPPDGKPVLETVHRGKRYKAVADGLRAVAVALNAQRGEGGGDAAPDAGTAGRGPASDPVRERGLSGAQGLLSMPPAEASSPGSDRPAPVPPTVGHPAPPEDPPPGFWRRWMPVVLGVVLGVVLVGTASGGAYWRHRVAADAREWLRVDRPDQALQRLASVPSALRGPLLLARLREVAQLSLDGLDATAEKAVLHDRLRALGGERADDADVRYIAARLDYLGSQLDQAEAGAAAAIEQDPAHAASHNLLGMLADARGNTAAAALHYQAAAQAARRAPQYASNWARTLLDLGRPAEAVQAYQQAPDLALAHAEKALALWALGDVAAAEQSQVAALALLDDPKVGKQAANGYDWVFTYVETGMPPEVVNVPLAGDNRRCYAAYGRGVSAALLAGKTDALPVPAECAGVPRFRAVLDVVDADLCRYLIGAQLPWADAARALRRGPLQRKADCPPRLAAPPQT